jgi:hypothetical protein
MIRYRVTWLNTETGNLRSLEGRATDPQHARREVYRLMRFVTKGNPNIKLHSVELIGKSKVAA